MKFQKHFISAVLFGCIALFLPACSSLPEKELQEARQMILDGKAECVLIHSGDIFAQKRGRGVNPLLTIYDTHQAEMKNGVIVDKVIGRAAAAIAICGEVRHVHGEVMSEDAVKFLEMHGITASSTLRVPRILNRDRSGLCPLEQSVQDITDPAEAVAALRAKIARLQRSK